MNKPEFERYLDEANDVIRRILAPAVGSVSGISDIAFDPEQAYCLFTGAVYTDPACCPSSVVCILDIHSGELTQLTTGERCDREPRFSSDGSLVSFFSDHQSPGRFRPYIIELANNNRIIRLPELEGIAEESMWAPVTKNLIYIAADPLADAACIHGAVATCDTAGRDGHAPVIDDGSQDNRWRRVWFYDCVTRQLWRPNLSGLNVWHACWCGEDRVVLTASDGPSEDDWFRAKLYVMDVSGASAALLYEPRYQLGHASCSPSGKYLAFVDAPASDRDLVFGPITLLHTQTGEVSVVNTLGADIGFLHWTSEDNMVFAGLRDMTFVAGSYTPSTGEASVIIESEEIHSGSVWPDAIACTDDSILFVAEGFDRPPALMSAGKAGVRVVASFDNPGFGYAKSLIGNVEAVRWESEDGLPISGWLIEPSAGARPYPLVTAVHGGPIWASNNYWLTVNRLNYLLLLRMGYALFMPNPRGSVGKGIDFMLRVRGDMGGMDVQDILSGVTAMTERGIASCHFLTGVSYGGYMTNWISCLDDRFKAGVSISGISDWLSFQFTTNVPSFARTFMDAGKGWRANFAERSPVHRADQIRTPLMLVTGMRDANVHASQSVMLHNAIQYHGGQSVLVQYPLEGHSVRGASESICHAALMLWWFDRYRTGFS